MRIGYLGTGSWGYCLARLLSTNGHEVISWTLDKGLAHSLSEGHAHPAFPNFPPLPAMQFTTSLEEVSDDVDLLIESVTSQGIRPVFTELLRIHPKIPPLVLTSKGFDQQTGSLLSDTLKELSGPSIEDSLALLSGPSFAQEVVHNKPTSVVVAASNLDFASKVAHAFQNPHFRVYMSTDITGVSLGGALKNVIAIACGISDGLQLGSGAQASLVTRGLHEMRKFARSYACQEETLIGLSGLGDLFLTCSSPLSRNFRFGQLLAQAFSPENAKEKISMVVEGAYTAASASKRGHELGIPLPITDAVYHIIYEGLSPQTAVRELMTRAVKQEML